MSNQITHAEGVVLCERIAKHEGCGPGWPDPMQRWARGERADWLSLWLTPHDSGWENHWTGEPVQVYAGDSLLLDYKRDLSDKRADELKRWRKARYALGTHRAYVCQPGIIEPHQVEDESGWGLFWIVGESFECKKHPQRQANCDWPAMVALVGMLTQRQQYHAPAKASNGQAKQSGLTGPQLEAVKRAFNACGFVPLTTAEIKRETGIDIPAGRFAKLLRHTEGIKAHDEMGKAVFELTATAKTEAA